MTTTDYGPFASESEARSAPAALEAAAQVTRLMDAGYRAPQTGEPRLDLLVTECHHAGVELGDYDHRCLRWLSGWETSGCMVVAGLIRRAYDAGRESAEG